MCFAGEDRAPAPAPGLNGDEDGGRVAVSIGSSASSGCASASSHFSRCTSTPPVLSALCGENVVLVYASRKEAWMWGYMVCGEKTRTHPASEPPTQAIIAGVKAGAFPAFAAALELPAGGGAGLLRMAK